MILIVDDTMYTCQLLLLVAKLVQIEGHCCSGGYAALEWLEHHRPDLIFLDLNMPDLSGLEVLRRIKADPGLRDLPVILHTASDDPASHQSARALGSYATLVKGNYQIREVTALMQKFVRPIPYPPPAAA